MADKAQRRGVVFHLSALSLATHRPSLSFPVLVITKFNKLAALFLSNGSPRASLPQLTVLTSSELTALFLATGSPVVSLPELIVFGSVDLSAMYFGNSSPTTDQIPELIISVPLPSSTTPILSGSSLPDATQVDIASNPLEWWTNAGAIQAYILNYLINPADASGVVAQLAQDHIDMLNGIPEPADVNAIEVFGNLSIPAVQQALWNKLNPAGS